MTKNDCKIEDPVLLIDAFNWSTRAFYAAWPGWEKPGGEPTDDRAIVSFAWALTNIIGKFKPSVTYFCVDAGRPAVRKNILPCYKAHRKSNPYLKPHRMMCTELVRRYLPVRIIKIDGYEADDTMARIAEYLHEKEEKIIIATRDRDLVQVRQHLQCNNVFVYDAEKDKKGLNNGLLEPSREDVPENVWKAIVGDSSDNIPSITGAVTANKIIDSGTLEEWLDGGLAKRKLEDEKNKELYEQVRELEKEPCRRDIFNRNLKITSLLGEHCVVPPLCRSYVDIETNKFDFDGLVRALETFKAVEEPEYAFQEEDGGGVAKQKRVYTPNYGNFNSIWSEMEMRDHFSRSYSPINL